jgi:hypothetical protein
MPIVATIGATRTRLTKKTVDQPGRHRCARKARMSANPSVEFRDAPLPKYETITPLRISRQERRIDPPC